MASNNSFPKPQTVEETDENCERSSSSSNWVRLNVGGKLFCTTIDTLTLREPESMLSAMFSGRHTLTQQLDGYFLIDRDGDYFGYILNWLRGGDVPTLEAPKYKQLLQEAEYFQLLGLVDAIKNMSDFTRIDVIKCIQSPERRFCGVNLSGLDLSKLDLSDIDFSHACLRNVSFSSANLNGAKFHCADAKGAIFRDSKLNNSKFFETKIDGASFVNADLHGTVFTRTTLSGADFTNANLELGLFCNNVDTQGCAFNNTNFIGCTFSKAINFRGASFVGVDLSGMNLCGACLVHCKFHKTNLKYANLRSADLTDANLEEVNLHQTDLRGAKFSKANYKILKDGGAKLEIRIYI